MNQHFDYLQTLRHYLNLQIEAQLNQDWETYQELEEIIKQLEGNK